MQRTAALPLMALTALLGACSSEPRQELAAAQQAVEHAKTADVEAYAPETLQTATQSLRSGEAEFVAQSKKHRLMRRYANARKLLEAAKIQAETAVAEAGAKRERGEAERSIREASEALNELPKDVAGSKYVVARRDALAAAEVELAKATPASYDGAHADAANRFKEVAAKARRIQSTFSATWQGMIVNVERKRSLRYQTYYLTLSGLASEEQTLAAASGMTLVVIDLRGTCREVPQGHCWLGDSTGKRYAQKVVVKSETGCQIGYEVPEAARGLVWHDGEEARDLEPIP